MPTSTSSARSWTSLGLLALGALLSGCTTLAQARQPTFKAATRWLAVGGAVLAAVMAVAYTVIFTAQGAQFVTTGNQSYPEARSCSTRPSGSSLQLVLELGNLLLAVGVIWISLNVMRVGLLPASSGTPACSPVRCSSSVPRARPGHPGLLAGGDRRVAGRSLAERRPAGMGGGRGRALGADGSGRRTSAARGRSVNVAPGCPTRRRSPRSSKTKPRRILGRGAVSASGASSADGAGPG